MECWCLLLAAVLTSGSNVTGAALTDRNALTLASSFLDENAIAFVVFIDCGATGTGVGLQLVECASECPVQCASECPVQCASECPVQCAINVLYSMPQNVLYSVP